MSEGNSYTEKEKSRWWRKEKVEMLKTNVKNGKGGWTPFWWLLIGRRSIIMCVCVCWYLGFGNCMWEFVVFDYNTLLIDSCHVRQRRNKVSVSNLPFCEVINELFSLWSTYLVIILLSIFLLHALKKLTKLISTRKINIIY